MVVGPKKKLSKEQRKLEKKLMKGARRVVSAFAGLSSVISSGHENNLSSLPRTNSAENEWPSN